MCRDIVVIRAIIWCGAAASALITSLSVADDSASTAANYSVDSESPLVNGEVMCFVKVGNIVTSLLVNTSHCGAILLPLPRSV